MSEELAKRIQALLHDKRTNIRPDTRTRTKSGKRQTPDDVLFARLKKVKLWPPPSAMTVEQVVAELEAREAAVNARNP